MKLWKRNAVVATIVLFICVALYLSWQYGQPAEEIEVFDPEISDGTVLAADPGGTSDGTSIESGLPADAPEDDYFEQARLSRRKARDSALAILSDAAGRAEASEEARNKAEYEIENMAKNAMLEATIENLIVAKGFEKCVVFINQEGISIVVSEPSGGMTSADAVKIKDIVLTESTIKVDAIKLVHVAV